MALTGPRGAPLRQRRYTVMLVPEGARSGIRQMTLSLAGLRALVAALGLMAAFSLAGLALLVREVVIDDSRGALLDENLVLRARLREIEGKLDQVDRELRRIRLYDTQLQDAPPEALPGWGPLEAEDVDAAALLGLDFGIDPGDAELQGEYGDPLGEAGLDDIDAVALLGPSEWADSLYLRTEATLEDLRMAEAEVGQIVESAEQFRAMKNAIPSIWPVDGVLTSGFGYRRSPFTRRLKFHKGIDLYGPVGTPIVAPASGVVITRKWDSGYGRMLEIDHGFGIVTRYAHTSRTYVREGDEVARGQVIATVGQTGRVTGPHLHYEVYVDGKLVDPTEYLE